MHGVEVGYCWNVLYYYVAYLGNKAVDDFVRIIKYEMSIEGIQVVTAWVLPLSCHEVVTTEHGHTLLLELWRALCHYIIPCACIVR